ncbi:hypothetical protein Ahy_B09g096355 isoform D [Arachis hypogaea]|uniref:Uncharacterized protein n=1 Tax=Arachis hypogaea TaxID=3818 RepID=A0A444XK49_ARAHY|nr:hypothetical protein Ahy_B09g096355 isoform D [Arachis hypogaea]
MLFSISMALGVPRLITLSASSVSKINTLEILARESCTPFANCFPST